MRWEVSIIQTPRRSCFFIELGSNSHRMQCRDHFTDLRKIDDRSCTFRDQGQLNSPAIRDMRIQVTNQKRRTQGLIVLKWFRWLLGISCWGLGSEIIYRKGGEFIDSRVRGRYLHFRQGGPRSRLDKENSFMTLNGAFANETLTSSGKTMRLTSESKRMAKQKTICLLK